MATVPNIAAAVNKAAVAASTTVLASAAQPAGSFLPGPGVPGIAQAFASAPTQNPAPADTGNNNNSGYTGPTAEQIAAEQERLRLENERKSALSSLKAMLSTWGIDGTGLSDQIWSWLTQGKGTNEVVANIRTTDAYNKRFAGMADLIKRGEFMDEATYIAQERAYRGVLQSWNLPTGFYDDPTDFGRFIANGVSVQELDDRVKSAQTFLDTNANSEYRKALNDLGVSDGSLLAYVLDGDRAQSVIQQQMKAAAMGGAANKYGFGLNADQMRMYGGTLGDQFNSIGTDQRMALEKSLSDLSVQADQDQRSTTIENDAYNRQDALDAGLLNDNKKKLASQNRAQREVARFSGSSGFTTGSLSNSGSF